MIRVLRIAALTAALMAIFVATGAVGLGGAGGQGEPQSSRGLASELDCGSDPIVIIHSDGHYVPVRPGRGAEGPQSDRAALKEFLREQRIPVSDASFARAARDGGRSRFVHRAGSRTEATASVTAIGATYYVPSFAACDRAASREGRDR